MDSNCTGRSVKYEISTMSVPEEVFHPLSFNDYVDPINVVDAITSGPSFNLSYNETTVRYKLQYSSEIRLSRVTEQHDRCSCY